jgi:cholesterol 7-dehydrogenase
MAFLKLAVFIALGLALVYPTTSSMLSNAEKIKSWYFLFVPIKLFRSLEDAGYIPDGVRPLKDVAQETKRRRKCGNLPPVYPNGWFHILSSWEIGTSEVKFVCCLGEHLAVFRGEPDSVPAPWREFGNRGSSRGKLHSVSFSGWEFQGDDGKCTKIPYSKSIPSLAKVKAWSCLERIGSVMLWFHAEGAEPSWIPEEIAEISSGKWIYRGRTTHMINAHIEVILQVSFVVSI